MDWTIPNHLSPRGHYKLRSKAGKDLVVHHNQVKACTIPFNKGEPYYPVWEAEEIEMVSMPREEMPEVQNVPLNRPLRLRQNVNPLCGLETSSPIAIYGGMVFVIDIAALLLYIGTVCSSQVIYALAKCVCDS